MAWVLNAWGVVLAEIPVSHYLQITLHEKPILVFI